MNVSFYEFLVDYIYEDDFEARHLKAEVEETRTGEKGENRVFGWQWMGHGDDGSMTNFSIQSR